MRRLTAFHLALILTAGFAVAERVDPRFAVIGTAQADDDDDNGGGGGGGGWGGGGGDDDDDDGWGRGRAFFPPAARPAPQPAPVYRPAPVHQSAPVYRPAPVYQPAPAARPAPFHQPAPVYIQRFDDDDDDDGGIRMAPAPILQPAPLTAPREANRPQEILTMGLTEADFSALLAQGFTLIEAQEAPGLAITLRRLAPPPGRTLAQARDAVRALPSGGGADFNHFYRPEQATPVMQALRPPVCQGAHCGAFAQIGWPVPQSREISCGPEVRLGLIDTGINAQHEAFLGARLTVHNLSDPAERDSALLHGTSVAGLLIGAPEGRTPGLTPDLPVTAVDAFHRAGTDERADAFAIVRALGLLAQEGVRVANLSLSGPPNAVLEEALARLSVERGMIFVAAAGNEGPHAPPAYPAAYPGVIAVTAVDGASRAYRRAGQGPHVDLAAPGVEVWTAASVRGGRAKSGTSFAAPFVAAAAARLLQQHPGLGAEQVAARLGGAARDLGAPGRDPVFGHGLLQMTSLGACARLGP